MRIQEPTKHPNGELNVNETSAKQEEKESTIKVKEYKKKEELGRV